MAKRKERELLLRLDYEIDFEDFTPEQCQQWLLGMYHYRKTGEILENIDQSVKRTLKHQAKEREEDKEAYNKVCEQRKKAVEKRREKKNDSIQTNTGVYDSIQTNTGDTNSNSNSNINNKKKDNNKLLSKEKEPTVSELVKAYEENELLVGKIKNTEVVRVRAEYKQRKKDRAYKSVKGFIQQLAVMSKTVENGLPRTDIAGRLQFAINQAEENERKGIVWNDKIEVDYQSFKKFNSIQGTNKQSTG